MRAVIILDLEAAHVGVPDGDFGPLLESQTPQPAGHVEGRLAHALQLEIGLDCGLVKVVLRGAELFGVEPPVPHGEIDVVAEPVGEGLELVSLHRRPRQGRSPQLLEQVGDLGRRLGHVFLEDIGRVRLIAQQPGALRPHSGDLCGKLPIVGLTAVGGELGVSTVELLAELTTLGKLHERRPARALEIECPGSLVVLIFGHDHCCAAHRLGETGKVCLILDQQGDGVHLLEQVFAKLGGEGRKLEVDLAQARLGLLIEVGATSHEVLVGLVEQAVLLGCELEIVAAVIHSLHPLEELFVEQDVVLVVREAGVDLPGQLLQPLARVRFVEIDEDEIRPLQQPARPLQRLDGVGKARVRGIARDLRHLVGFGHHRRFEGRQKVLLPDLVKRRRPEWGIPVAEQGVGRGGTAHVARGADDDSDGRCGDQHQGSVVH